MNKKLDKCPLCSSKRIKFFCNGKDNLIKNNIEYPLFRCGKCETIFLNPQPSERLSKEFYPKEYYSYRPLRKKDKKIKFRIFLYRVFSERKFFFLKLFLWPLKNHLRSIPEIKRGKLLDIGCGSGQFIYEMRKLGFEVYGIEPGKIKKDKENLKIFKGFLKDYPLKKEYFDIITLNHVLEHVKNPKKEIIKIKKMLKKGGKLVIGVPNIDSIGFYLTKERWTALDAPRHQFNFSQKGLVDLLIKNKFKIDKIVHNTRGDYFLSSLFGNSIINNKGSRVLASLFLNLIKKGDQIEVICTKK